MKQNTLGKLLGAGAACVLAVSSAMAQGVGVSANVGPVGVGVGVGVPGTFSAYTPGQDYFMFRGETGDPVRYYYSKDTEIVDPTGARVEWSAVRPDLPATVYYEKTGDRMVVKRVVVKKPVSEITRQTTTTTTTTTHP